MGVPHSADKGVPPPRSEQGGGVPPRQQNGVPPPPHPRLDGVNPPPPPSSAKRALATRRAVCLLRSRRRTFFFHLIILLSPHDSYVQAKREYFDCCTPLSFMLCKFLMKLFHEEFAVPAAICTVNVMSTQIPSGLLNFYQK